MKTSTTHTVLTLIAAAIVYLAAPDVARAGQDQAIGALIGAGAGGVIGNQFGRGGGRVAATLGGVFAGGALGSAVGENMDRSAFARNRGGYAPVYASSGDYYAAGYDYTPNYVAPLAPPPESFDHAYVDQDIGSYCREFSQTVRIGRELRETYGTACLQPDGSWRVVQ